MSQNLRDEMVPLKGRGFEIPNRYLRRANPTIRLNHHPAGF